MLFFSSLHHSYKSFISILQWENEDSERLGDLFRLHNYKDVIKFYFFFSYPVFLLEHQSYSYCDSNFQQIECRGSAPLSGKIITSFVSLTFLKFSISFNYVKRQKPHRNQQYLWLSQMEITEFMSQWSWCRFFKILFMLFVISKLWLLLTHWWILVFT